MIYMKTREFNFRIGAFIALLILISNTQTMAQSPGFTYGNNIDYGTNPPSHTRSYVYSNISVSVLPVVLDRFNKDEITDSTNYSYNWNDQKVKGLGSRKLDIHIRYIEYKNPSPDIAKMETFDVSITRNEKQYIHELKFWNTLRLNRIFKKIYKEAT